MNCRSEGSSTVDNYAHRRISKDTYPLCSRSRRELMTFNMLPDDVLLEIFDFYLIQIDKGFRYSSKNLEGTEGWIMLAHVCQRWRSVVFQSPHRLNLRLVCTGNTPTRDTLDIWPPFPLIIICQGRHLDASVDNIIAALEHNDRVRQIKLLNLEGPVFGYIAACAAILKPFPELTDLWLNATDTREAILPDAFLGGTAQRLRSFWLIGIPFPGLPKLLLSATHIIKLDLYGIPPSGYIPPEAMATSLSALTSIEFLRLWFYSPRPRPALESHHLPPPLPTRSILPNLTKVRFKGASEYLEEILTRINAPRLDELNIILFNEIIFDTPQLLQFISRRPTLRTPEIGIIAFDYDGIIVKLLSQTFHHGVLRVKISCEVSDWQLSSIEQVCTSSLPPLSTLEDLYIFENQPYRGEPPCWQGDVENALWLDLLRSFVAVKNLYLSEEFVPRIAPALQELVGVRTTEVLPTLENIFLEGFQPPGPLHEGIEKLVAARRLTSHPLAVSPLDRERRKEFFDWHIFVDLYE